MRMAHTARLHAGAAFPPALYSEHVARLSRLPPSHRPRGRVAWTSPHAPALRATLTAGPAGGGLYASLCKPAQEIDDVGRKRGLQV